MHIICIVAWACAVLGHPLDSSEALVETHSGGPKETDGRASRARISRGGKRVKTCTALKIHVGLKIGGGAAR